MQLIIKENTQNMDWQAVKDLLVAVNMSTHSPEQYQAAFSNSDRVIFLFDGSRLIGCGRMLSDFTYQAAIYDIAVHPDYQGLGLGKTICQNLLQDTDNINVILFANPDKMSFYAKFGFVSMKTGMGKFVDLQHYRAKGLVD